VARPLILKCSCKIIEPATYIFLDMTLEAITCKLAYLHGRGDLTFQEIAKLMDVSLRGEVTPADEFPEPPFSSELNRATRQGRKHL
jgi:hypothetical protein